MLKYFPLLLLDMKFNVSLKMYFVILVIKSGLNLSADKKEIEFHFIEAKRHRSIEK